MTLQDVQQQLLLDRLRQAGGRPVAFDELRLNGIAFPAAIVAELELAGYAIDHVHDHGRLVGVRLLASDERDHSAAPLPGRLAWRRR